MLLSFRLLAASKYRYDDFIGRPSGGIRDGDKFIERLPCEIASLGCAGQQLVPAR
jgi:hypothetical protein